MFWQQVEAGSFDTVIVPCLAEEATFIAIPKGVRWMVVLPGGEALDVPTEQEARETAERHRGVLFAVVVVAP
jgi:hypothetical protein